MINSFKEIILTLVGGNTLLFHALYGSILAVVIIIVGKISQYVLQFTAKKIFSRTNTTLDDEVIEIIRSKVILISIIIGIYVGTNEIRLGLPKNAEFLISFLNYVNTALYILSIIVVAIITIQVARMISTHTFRRIAEKHKNDEINKSLAPLVNRVVAIVVIVLTTIVALEHFGQSVTSILTILGAGSLALGLAAQDTLTNMISGFIIMLDRPFRVGDRVKIPSGEVGDIFEIGLRSTKILDFDNNLLIVPNNELIKTRIINYGYPVGEIRVVVDVNVAYGTHVDDVKKILTDVAKNNTKVLREPIPEAFLMNFGDSALQFRLVCRVSSFQDQFLVAERIRVDVYEEFMRRGIEIPLPQRVVQHKNEKTHALQAPSKRKKTSR